MVKGVNKTVIEVNNTGSKLFEKIVFYVTPEYGKLNAKQLKRAVNNFAFNFDHHKPNQSLRKRYIRKRRLLLICFGTALLTVIGAILLLIL